MRHEKEDKMDSDGEKAKHNKYKCDSSDWNIINEMDEESIETIESVPYSQNNYYLSEESIETLEYVRPAGSIVPFSQDNYYLGYKHDPMEYEGATLDLQVTEDKTVIGDNIEERDSPEARKVN